MARQFAVINAVTNEWVTERSTRSAAEADLENMRMTGHKFILVEIIIDENESMKPVNTD